MIAIPNRPKLWTLHRLTRRIRHSRRILRIRRWSFVVATAEQLMRLKVA
jgi:hypothetical protein